MNLTINVGNMKNALEVLKKIKETNYAPFDIKITNCHITRINSLVGFTLFRKDILYVNSRALWEIMHEVGGRGSHNYHGLTIEDVYYGLKNASQPQSVVRVKDTRFALISVELCHFDKPLMIVIEVGSELLGKVNANVNKIVTIYPEHNVAEFVNTRKPKDILYERISPSTSVQKSAEKRK